MPHIDDYARVGHSPKRFDMPFSVPHRPPVITGPLGRHGAVMNQIPVATVHRMKLAQASLHRHPQIAPRYRLF